MKQVIVFSKLALYGLGFCLVSIFLFTSCKKEEFSMNSTKSNGIYQGVTSSMLASSYTEVESTIGCKLYKNGNNYIQEINLDCGAKVYPMIYGTKSYLTSDGAPTFTRKGIANFWSYSIPDITKFALTNLSFFDVAISPTTLPFPLKNIGILAYGTGGTKTEVIDGVPKKTLWINTNSVTKKQYAGVADFKVSGTNPPTTIDGWYKLYNYTNIKSILSGYEIAIVGFATSVDKSSSAKIGRTLIGVSGDGKKIYILIAYASTTLNAVNELKTFMGVTSTSRIVQFDGGGSSQLKSNKNSMAGCSSSTGQPDNRTIPVCILSTPGVKCN